MYPEHRTAAELSINRAERDNKTRHKRRPRLISPATNESMIIHYEDLRNRGIPVSAELLALECIRADPTLGAVTIQNMKRCVLRFLCTRHVTHHVIIHRAQNIRYHDDVCQDWLTYMNAQIQTNKFLSQYIVNANETNIDFNSTVRTTLEGVGTRSINIKCNGSSSRCTVMLGCSLSGVKLPALILFKASENGIIARELFNDTYIHDWSIYYAVQNMAWIDTRTYQDWV